MLKNVKDFNPIVFSEWTTGIIERDADHQVLEAVAVEVRLQHRGLRHATRRCREGKR
jgi:hypothetical protein